MRGDRPPPPWDETSEEGRETNVHGHQEVLGPIIGKRKSQGWEGRSQDLQSSYLMEGKKARFAWRGGNYISSGNGQTPLSSSILEIFSYLWIENERTNDTQGWGGGLVHKCSRWSDKGGRLLNRKKFESKKMGKRSLKYGSKRGPRNVGGRGNRKEGGFLSGEQGVRTRRG